MTDRVAVVAGGTAGVGRATVAALIDKGYRVGILARGQSRLDQLETEYGDKVVCRTCDVSDADAVSRAGAEIEERLGPISVWVNAAMQTSFSPFPGMKPDEFQRIVDTTLIGVVNGTRTALALMEQRNSGRIVNVGSGLSYRSVPYQSAYCASKHGINGFTAAIRSELIREGSHITVSLVQLPALNTPQFDWALNRLPKKPQPAPPIFQPEVAARAILRAVREGRREYFVGSSVLQLVFGNMVLPDWLDHKLADSGAEMQKSDSDEPGGRPNNIEGPVSGVEATARGRFSHRASNSALIIDADRARLIALGVPLLLVLCLGLLIG
ncbi:SDR family oxidoreductase [Tateyamaria omphalii]|uniref:Short-chain dehydrogenase n=1 Tax=Tateyamaria omphalii TaxID=299262 RepID=A0A1P8MRF2_9RHOB|nr:SDR family oxidoreductase [Tateyamaria omphalii]APX10549.1 short-chain dehydrogenase [Tateyamaria omphalii]